MARPLHFFRDISPKICHIGGTADKYRSPNTGEARRRMNAITHPPPAVAPDDDPVAVALGDPATRRDLIAQAMSRLNRWLADRPRASRLQEAEEIANEVVERVLSNRAKYDSARGGLRGGSRRR